MGWDGTEVTPQIRSLIEDHHLGSIILTAKNLKCESLASYLLKAMNHANLLKLPNKLLSLFKNYRLSPRMRVIHNPC